MFEISSSHTQLRPWRRAWTEDPSVLTINHGCMDWTAVCSVAWQRARPPVYDVRREFVKTRDDVTTNVVRNVHTVASPPTGTRLRALYTPKNWPESNRKVRWLFRYALHWVRCSRYWQDRRRNAKTRTELHGVIRAWTKRAYSCLHDDMRIHD